MTMYEAEVEWLEQANADQADLKAAIFEDEDFKEYIRDVGLKETLYELTSFHRSISENLRTNQITDLTTAPEWAKKAVRLSARVKARRQQLRKVVRDNYGAEAVEAINQRVDEEVA